MNRTTTRLGRFAPLAAMVLTVAAALLSLAGCGGSDSTAASSSSSEAASITKKELIKKGDAICRKTDQAQREAVRAYESKHGEAANPTELEAELAQIAPPPLRAEVKELAALGAPEGEEAQVKDIITGFEEALKSTEAEPSILLSVSEGYFLKPDKLAEKYGFKDCAQAL